METEKRAPSVLIIDQVDRTRFEHLEILVEKGQKVDIRNAREKENESWRLFENSTRERYRPTPKKSVPRDS